MTECGAGRLGAGESVRLKMLGGGRSSGTPRRGVQPATDDDEDFPLTGSDRLTADQLNITALEVSQSAADHDATDGLSRTCDQYHKTAVLSLG